MKPEIPKTDSIEELARFWDGHDVTDHERDLEEVPSPFVRSGGVQVSVPRASPGSTSLPSTILSGSSE